jgi:alpha-ribazole phosphatase
VIDNDTKDAIVTQWWWVRHAPVPGPRDQIKGRLDLPSDTSDTRTFAIQAARLPKDAVVFTSSRIRTQQTLAALVKAGFDAPSPQIEPDFDEQDFGRFQGHTWGALAGDPALDAFWKDPANTPAPGGESFAQLVDRVRRGIARVGTLHAGKTIVIVAHAGTIRSALCVAMGIAPKAGLTFAISTVSITRIEGIDAAWRVRTVNWLPDDA